MIISRVPSSVVSRTEASLASECRTTLVSASAAMRYAATSTEDGRAGMDSGASTITLMGLNRVPSSRSAPTSPSSSSAAGRSPYASCRTASTDCRS